MHVPSKSGNVFEIYKQPEEKIIEAKKSNLYTKLEPASSSRGD